MLFIVLRLVILIYKDNFCFHTTLASLYLNTTVFRRTLHPLGTIKNRFRGTFQPRLKVTLKGDIINENADRN